MQVPVAIGTPTSVLEEVAQRVDTFLRANKGEYTGNRECVYKDVQDTWPVRTIIFVAWQYTHTSELTNLSLCPNSFGTEHSFSEVWLCVCALVCAVVCTMTYRIAYLTPAAGSCAWLSHPLSRAWRCLQVLTWAAR